MASGSQRMSGGVKFEEGHSLIRGDDIDDYDPDQDPEAKRALRAKLRAQDYRVSEWAKDPKAVDIEEMSRELQNQNMTFQEVKAPQEAALDSGFLTQLSGIATARARNLKHDAAGFDVDDFLLKLTTYLGGNQVEPNVDEDEDDMDGQVQDLDWEKLGWRALGYARRAPGIDFMLGPLNLEQKKRNVTKRARQEKTNTVEVKPKELTEDDMAKEDNETTKNIGGLYAIIEELELVNVFKLICNPKSFAQTVENLFYLSFLIKDGKVALELDEEDGLRCYAVAEYTAEDRAEEGLADVRKFQAVLQLDEEAWELAIQTWDIDEPLFPHRPVPPEHTYKFYGR